MSSIYGQCLCSSPSSHVPPPHHMSLLIIICPSPSDNPTWHDRKMCVLNYHNTKEQSFMNDRTHVFSVHAEHMCSLCMQNTCVLCACRIGMFFPYSVWYADSIFGWLVTLCPLGKDRNVTSCDIMWHHGWRHKRNIHTICSSRTW